MEEGCYPQHGPHVGLPASNPHGEKAQDTPLMVAGPGLGHGLPSQAGGRACPWRWGEDTGGLCSAGLLEGPTLSRGRGVREPGEGMGSACPLSPRREGPKDPEWAGVSLPHPHLSPAFLAWLPPSPAAP